MLRRQIPIRTFAEWDDRRPGFCEAELVAHDGGSGHGEYCQTLDLTCVATGWTEMRALPTKAQRWVLQALEEIRAALPFPLLGLDCDNGGEFINVEVFRWCEAEEVTFTCTRPYRKNDNCFVEQKNWPVVRQQVGYLRYDTPQELRPPSPLRQLLPAPDAARGQDPAGCRCQGLQDLRCRPYPLPAKCSTPRTSTTTPRTSSGGAT